jgi:hypothetical protein
MMPTKPRLKHSKQVIATNISLHLLSPSVIRKLGRATDFWKWQLGLSKPVAIFKTGISVFKNSKTGIPVLKPVLKFLMNN